MLRPTVSSLAFALVPCVAASDTQAQDTFTLVELAPNVHIALVTPNPPRYVFANCEHAKPTIAAVDSRPPSGAAKCML